MKERKGFLQKLAEGAVLPIDSIPGQPILELAGDHRVLIENHCGVKEYSRERIRVGVKYGVIAVCGSGLELICMTREQLVIFGKIDTIALHRR